MSLAEGAELGEGVESSVLRPTARGLSLIPNGVCVLVCRSFLMHLMKVFRETHSLVCVQHSRGQQAESNPNSNPAASSGAPSSERRPTCLRAPVFLPLTSSKIHLLFALSPPRHSNFLPWFLSLGTQPVLIPQGLSLQLVCGALPSLPSTLGCFCPSRPRNRTATPVPCPPQTYPLLTGVLSRSQRPQVT